MKIPSSRFHLRSVLLFSCFLGVIFAYIGSVRHQYIRELHVIGQLRCKGSVDYVTEYSLRKGSGAFSKYLAWWDRIVAVDLDRGTFEGADFEMLQELTNLESISIWNARGLTDQALVDIAHTYPDLDNLSIVECPISDRSARAVGSLRRLKTLSLSFTRITDDGIASLVDLEELVVVDLTGNRITDDCIPVFGHWPRLESLDISWTDMSLSAVNELINARPDISVNATDLE